MRKRERERAREIYREKVDTELLQENVNNL